MFFFSYFSPFLSFLYPSEISVIHPVKVRQQKWDMIVMEKNEGDQLARRQKKKKDKCTSQQTKGQRLKTIVLYTKRRRFYCKKEALDDNLTGHVWGRHPKRKRFSYSAPINQSLGLSMYIQWIFRRTTSVVSVINISISYTSVSHPTSLFSVCSKCFYGFRSYW